MTDLLAFVALSESSSVDVFDLVTHSPVHSIGVDGGPIGLCLNPGKTTAYVACSTAGTVIPIDVATFTAGSPVSGFTYPTFLAVTPDGTKLYVTQNTSAEVVPVTLPSTLGSSISVISNPSRIAITPDGSVALVACYEPSGTSVIAIPADTVTTLGVPDSLDVAVSPDGTKAYFACYIDGTYPVTLPSTVGTPITDISTNNVICYSADGSTVFVGDQTDGYVWPVDTSTNTPGTPVALPVGVATDLKLSPDGLTLYALTNGVDSAIYPITISSMTIGTPTPISSETGEMVLVPAAPPPPVSAWTIGEVGFGSAG